MTKLSCTELHCTEIGVITVARRYSLQAIFAIFDQQKVSFMLLLPFVVTLVTLKERKKKEKKKKKSKKKSERRKKPKKNP